jgi:hypothetical protein
MFCVYQQGLINAVIEMFPDAEHRFCMRHLYQNFHSIHKGETLKNDLWAIGRSSNVPLWEKNMEQMKKDSLEAYAWVEEVAPSVENIGRCNIKFRMKQIMMNTGTSMHKSNILDNINSIAGNS